MKGTLRYSVIKEIEIDFDENTFSTKENIENFWNDIASREGNVIKIEGIEISNSNGETIFS